jgi:hypothetical protein
MYLAVNVIAAGMMIKSGFLLGDAAELAVDSNASIFIATALSLAVYLLVGVVLFRALTRLTLFRRQEPLASARRNREAMIVGTFLLVLQTGFFAFNLSEGINVAGSTNVTTDSKLNLLFILMQPDLFFFVYYGYYRETRLFKYNLAAYVVSNFLRGWSGFLLTIAFFEWCRAYRKGTLRGRTVLILGLLGLLAYPGLLAVKWYIRINTGASLDDVTTLADIATSNFEAGTYFEAVVGGVAHMVDRLQQVSIVAAIMQKRDALQQLLAFNQMTPFWWEGLPQLALTKALALTETSTLGVMLTDVVANLPSAELGSWSIAPGLAGWIVLEPLWTPFLIGYVVLLCLLSVVLTPGCQHPGGTRDMLWYAWLVFLIPGWITAFTGVICAMTVFAATRAVSRRF